MAGSCSTMSTKRLGCRAQSRRTFLSATRDQRHGSRLTTRLSRPFPHSKGGFTTMEWTPPGSDATSLPASADTHQRNQEETEMDATTVAVDVAKSVFENRYRGSRVARHRAASIQPKAARALPGDGGARSPRVPGSEYPRRA